MYIDEAISTYLYLKDRPQTAMNGNLREMRDLAWSTICQHAETVIQNDGYRNGEKRPTVYSITNGHQQSD